MSDLETLREQFEQVKRLGLSLNMQRGQPSDDNFNQANPMLTIVGAADLVTPSGVAIRNYPGGLAGIPEARALFGEMIGVRPEETIVGNNSSLKLMSNTLMWAMLRGLKNSPRPWCKEATSKFIVTVPGYDRHFTLLEALGIEMVAVGMTPGGPDMDAVEALAQDPAVRGMMFVPTYSNPTGETVSAETVRRLASMPTAAPDFTIFADDAYVVHHLEGEGERPLNLLRACEAAGNPDRVYLFGSTSKMTFAGAGIGFMASSVGNVKYLLALVNTQFIGPNKVEQYRHVKFLRQYPGGIAGLMRDHAAILRPKFAVVDAVLTRELGGAGLATWSKPKGGYFVSLDTTKPVADRVVALAAEAGVSLTPAGATYPHEHDPHNSNIRLSPSRPPLAEVEKAMEVVALCVKLASAEYDG